MALDLSWNRTTILRALVAVFFVIAAVLKLLAVKFEVDTFLRFGYPLWFMYVVGLAELAGAVLLWVRGAVGYGALLLVAVMIGALFSHIRGGDPISKMVPAAIILVLMAGLAYGRRGEILAPVSGGVPQR